MAKNEQAGLVVTVKDDTITVKKLGTDYAAEYKRQSDEPHLRLFYSWIDPNIESLEYAEFRAAAWQAVRHKARELGWIV